jgi:hypothetical protein
MQSVSLGNAYDNRAFDVDSVFGISKLGREDRLADAEEMYKEALCVKELRLGRVSLDVAQTLTSLAGLHEKQDRLADAEAMYKEALCVRELRLGRESSRWVA